MFTNALPSELIDVVAALDPDAYSNGVAVSSGYADMSDYEAALAVELVGTMQSSSTVNLKLQSAEAATGGTDITGKAITQLTQAGSDSDKQALINLRRDELTAGHRYVKLVRTIGAAASDEACLLLGLKGALAVNRKPSEVVALVGCVDPDAYAPNDYDSDWIDMTDWHAALGVLMIGDLGTAGTVTMKWQQATTSGGTPKDVTGRVTSVYDQTDSPNPSNAQVKLDLRAEDMDAENGYRWARLLVTVGDGTSPFNATSDVAAVAFGVFPKIGVASDFDVASVDEIVG